MCVKNVDSMEITVKSVLFNNPDNGWSVIRFNTDRDDLLQTAVGSLHQVQAGETLRITGEWVIDPRFGRQFRVDSFIPVLPSTTDGIEKYLGSGMIHGVGKEMAARLVRHFGQSVFDVIEGDPKRLQDVEGIGPKRAVSIVNAWSEQKAVREIMIFLRSLGIGTAHACKIFRRFGDKAVGTVRSNPYCLVEDVSGIGFKTADKIALSMGLGRDAPRRIEAGIVYLLREAATIGHLYLPRADLLEKTADVLQVKIPDIDSAVSRLAEKSRIVVDSGLVYLNDLYKAEVDVAERLHRYLEFRTPPLAGRPETLLKAFEDSVGFELAPLQRMAVIKALHNKVVIITGGPGTGKTTLLQALIRVAQGEDARVKLCAPTGRAAKRLAEATGREAVTIHRLLSYSPREHRFLRDDDSPLRLDLLVVDEVSMVDLPLFRALLTALPPGSRLVLVGDVDQLPSVGPGAVLRDLIRSERVDVVRLNTIFRQEGGSRIVLNAHRINSGRIPLETPRGQASDFYLIRKKRPEEVLDLMKRLLTRRIPEVFGLDPQRDVQILTPMHKGLLGASNLNREFQKLLNPEGKSITRRDLDFREGDRVMQLSNDYEKEVWNGDIGWIEKVFQQDGRISVRFDDRLVDYEGPELDELTLAYACSVHKAQGSEYPVVVLPVHTQHYVMLKRNLLYTGITRGRKLVVMVGNAKAFSIAVRNDRKTERNSQLASRLSSMTGDARVTTKGESIP